MTTETQTWPTNGIALVYPYSKFNVIQWFGNIEGMPPSYQPQWPQWQRSLFWFFRNFMFNFFRFVVGVEDKIITVTGDVPVFTTLWSECVPPSTGFKHSLISASGWPPLPFVSYSGKYVIWYVGWLPSGGRLGAKFNLVA